MSDVPVQHFYLGVDGGGTGCRARIVDEAGNVLGQGLSGPATIRLGIEAAWASIARAFGEAIQEARIGTTDLARIFAGIGLAGIGRKGAVEALRAIEHPFAGIDFISDGLGACLGAHSGRDGGIVIAGTGSIGLGFVGETMLRVGGYGFPISDEGSGADLGLKVVQLALRAHDGRYGHSALLREVMHRFHDDPAEVVAWMDRASATEYAALAPTVMRHADQGDAAGRRISPTSKRRLRSATGEPSVVTRYTVGRSRTASLVLSYRRYAGATALNTRKREVAPRPVSPRLRTR